MSLVAPNDDEVPCTEIGSCLFGNRVITILVSSLISNLGQLRGPCEYQLDEDPTTLAYLCAVNLLLSLSMRNMWPSARVNP